MANVHRRSNHLNRIRINGEWFFEDVDLRNEILHAFKGLLCANNTWHLTFDAMSFERRDPTEATRLESSFIEEEVLAAFKGVMW